MCGNHRVDGSPIGHRHDGPVFLPRRRGRRVMRRRAFLGEMGRGTMAFAVLAPTALAACGDDGAAAPPSTTASPSTVGTTATTDPTPTAGADPSSTAPLTWARTDLGFVSAYVLARGDQAAVVDTGVAGSADDIGETLAGIGLTFADVRHVVLTHLHPDHAGSIAAVMALAEGASAHAGAADIGGIDHEPIVTAADGDDVFGLEVIATPGHTAGHISVVDHDAGLLVAGDAINTADGGVQGPNPAFTADLATANASVQRLAELTFNVVLAGHGDPVTDRADTAVRALAATL